MLGPSRLLRIAVALAVTWIERWQQRRTLEEMDDHHLADIGLTRRDALREARRPFWRGAEPEDGAAIQARFTAFSEKPSDRRGSPSGRRKRPGLPDGTIMGKSR
jgi:uncharacterized protein YjiS (DUF1127 family)